MSIDNTKNKGNLIVQRQDTRKYLQKMKSSLLEGQQPSSTYLCTLEDERRAIYEYNDAQYLENLQDECRLRRQ